MHRLAGFKGRGTVADISKAHPLVLMATDCQGLDMAARTRTRKITRQTKNSVQLLQVLGGTVAGRGLAVSRCGGCAPGDRKSRALAMAAVLVEKSIVAAAPLSRCVSPSEGIERQMAAASSRNKSVARDVRIST